MTSSVNESRHHTNLQAGDAFVRLPTEAEIAAEEAAAKLAASTSSDGYVYGYTASEREAPPYISDGELLLWMQSKSQEVYGEVREVMGVSTERSKLMQDLTRLKGKIDSGEPIEGVLEEMDALQAAYAGTQYEGVIATLCGDAARAKLVAEEAVSTQGYTLKYDDQLSGDIQAEIDKLGRDDQLALVQLQDLMSNLREMTQMVSNVQASGDQAANRIVGNLVS